MRVRYELNEMTRWDGMSERDRGLCTDEARLFLVGSKKWIGAEATSPSVKHVGGGRFESTLEDHNDHLLKYIDQEILRHLNVLRRNGVNQPAVPFYVAVWNEAMAIPDNELDGSSEFETPIVLGMVRAQGTAMLVGSYNETPGDKHMMAELSRRGLIRR